MTADRTCKHGESAGRCACFSALPVSPPDPRMLEFLRAFIAGSLNQDFKPWAQRLYRELYNEAGGAIPEEQPTPETAKLFSGEQSRQLWRGINTIQSVEDAKGAIYAVCCLLQVLESRVYRIEGAQK